MKKLDYYILDVFSDKQYKGNPLSVVLMGEDLSLDQFKNIAREFGYSETSFVRYSATDNAYKVRSFTPAGVEVGGAGHNLLGAVCLALLKGWEIFKGQTGEQFVIMTDEKIHIAVRCDEAGLPFVEMKQQTAIMQKIVPAMIISQAIGLAPGDVCIKDWQPAVVKTEVAHLMVPVKDIDALNRAIVNKPLLHNASEQFGFEGCYLFTIDASKPGYIAEARFFNPGIGIDEDAATGSAAGPLTGYLLNHNYIVAAEDYTILQGAKMQQESTIHAKVVDDSIWISGTSVIVMEGQLFV
jgi:trans-2,3-dihydro-3-hydroxyanthranilate isomerase